jgi:hypothetical protein
MSNQNINQITGEVIEEQEERGVVIYNPQRIEMVRGMELDIAKMDFKQKLAAVQEVSNFIGGNAESMDAYTNMDLMIGGCMQHNVTVKNNDGYLTNAVRTVIILTSVNGIECHPPKKVKMVSVSADRYFGSFIVPMFGRGIWRESIPMIVRREAIRSGIGSTFTFEVPYLDAVKTTPHKDSKTKVTEEK